MREDSNRRKRTVGTVILITIALLAWVTVPVAAIWWLSTQTHQAEVAPSATTWVPVSKHEGHLSRNASIYMTWGEFSPIVAPQWSGTVTESNLSIGQTILSGSSLLTIDGVQRTGYSTPQPFYRALGLGSRGDDVTALRGLLASKGFSVSTSTALDARDLRAIRSFAASIGVADSTRISAFDPGWVIFLPGSEVQVAKTQLVVGSPAPAAGQTIAELSPYLSAARIVERVDATATDVTATVDPSSLIPMPIKPGEQVLVAGKALGVTPDFSSLTSEGLTAIHGLAKPGAPLVAASLVSDGQSGLWIVPSASLMTGSAGNACVLDSREGHTSSVRITVVTSEGTNAVVAGALSFADSVALDARNGQISCH